jgi:hypothetical protein
MTIGLDLIKELAERAQGRNPVWALQAVTTGAPTTVLSGIDVDEAILAMVHVGLRYEVHNHSSRVTVTTTDLTTSVYTVTVDGTAVAYDASAELPATLQALLDGIADAINLDATVNLVVLASVETVDDTLTLVLRNITGEASTHTTAVSVAGGTGVLAFVEDAISAALRLFGLARNSTLPWVKVNGADYTLDHLGFLERFEVSGLSRFYVEVHTIVGPLSPVPTPVVSSSVGPCEVES